MQTATELEIMNVLVLSTRHITQETSAGLDDGTSDGEPIIYPAPIIPFSKYGWIIYIGGKGDCETSSPSLAACCEFAWKHGLEWLRLDSDGPEVEDLPQYDW